MKLTSHEIIVEYYSKVKDDYPGMTLEHFEKICHAPFELVKSEMNKGNCTAIRLVYFGTFFVYPKRAEQLLRKLEEEVKKDKIRPETFIKKKEIIENYLKRVNYETVPE